MALKIGLFVVVALSVVDLSTQINPTYIDCANEMNTVVSGVSSEKFTIIPPDSVDNPLPIELTTQMEIVKIHGIDSEMQTLSITVMFKMTWSDYRLAAKNSGTYFGTVCSSSNYTSWRFNIEAVNRIPWYPQWVVSNGGKDVLIHGAWNYYPAIVRTNGDIEWLAMYHLETECIQDIFYFPADYQKCNISVSWPMTDKSVISILTPGDQPAIVLQNEKGAKTSLWDLEGQRFEMGSGSVPSVNFCLLLSRRSKFYIAAMMVPIFLINLMVFCGLILPPMSPKKIIIALFNLTTVFMTNIEYYEFLPQTSDERKSPVVMYFFASHTMFAAFTVAFSCFVYRVGEFREMTDDDSNHHHHKHHHNGPDGAKLEKVEEEIEQAHNSWAAGSLIGGFTHGRLKNVSLEKLNTIGCIVYGVFCLGSYIVCLGFIYGLSTVKIGRLLADAYSRVQVVAK